MSRRKSGNKTYLIKDEEAHIVTTSKIDGAHGLPRYISTFTNKLQQFLHEVGQRIISNVIKSESAQRYACRVIHRVDRKKE